MMIGGILFDAMQIDEDRDKEEAQRGEGVGAPGGGHVRGKSGEICMDCMISLARRDLHSSLIALSCLLKSNTADNAH